MEDFTEWWSKHSDELSHLHPQILEQWVYRHWYDSEFSFLPLDTMKWELVAMSGKEILSSVKRELSRILNPEFDYETFQGRHGGDKLPTAVALDSGTWDYPIIALSTPNGWRTKRTENHERIIVEIDERLMLIEGHQRHKYLNALHELAIAPDGLHKVFVITSPLAN